MSAPENPPLPPIFAAPGWGSVSQFQYSLEQRAAVLPRVAPDREDDVREHETDHRVAVPAVPDGEPVEPDEPLEERQPCEQEHLDQRQVAGEQRRQPPEADQRGVEAVPVVAEAVGCRPRPRSRASRRRCRPRTPTGRASPRSVDGGSERHRAAWSHSSLRPGPRSSPSSEARPGDVQSAQRRRRAAHPEMRSAGREIALIDG